MLPDILKFHYSVVKGEPQTVTGPTGRAYKKLPSLAERQTSAEWIAKLADRKQSEESQTTTPELTADDLTREKIADLRNAVRTAVGLRRSELAVDIGAKTVDLIEDGDLTVVDPIDGGTVESITDPKQIFEHDRARATVTPRQDDSRIELGASFYALLETQAGSGKQIYRLYNANHEAFAVKGTADIARKHFAEHTTVGMQLAKNAAGCD